MHKLSREKQAYGICSTVCERVGSFVRVLCVRFFLFAFMCVYDVKFRIDKVVYLLTLATRFSAHPIRRKIYQQVTQKQIRWKSQKGGNVWLLDAMIPSTF